MKSAQFLLKEIKEENTARAARAQKAAEKWLADNEGWIERNLKEQKTAICRFNRSISYEPEIAYKKEEVVAVMQLLQNLGYVVEMEEGLKEFQLRIVFPPFD